jgi:hypothetical protein
VTPATNPHPLDVSATTSGWTAQCPNAGPHQLQADAFPLYTPNTDALAIILAQTLPLNTGRIRRLSDQDVYYLGGGLGKGLHAWSALFAPYYSTGEDIDRMFDCLKRNPSLAPGILICPRDYPRNVDLPGKHTPVAIDEIIKMRGGQFHYDAQRLAHALNRKTPPKAPGRPTESKAAVQLAEARRRLNLAARNADAELEAIKQMIFSTLGPIQLPGDKTIRYEWLKEHFEKIRFPESPE